MTPATLQPIIGLEVHAQLLTDSKMFCACSARYAEAPPNQHVCAVCGGMPGALPVINRRALELTIRTALALQCEVRRQIKFDRKNYSYPDIPKGYQISQFDRPVGEHGSLELSVDSREIRCGIVRVHLEEDTGKSFHVRREGRDVSLVDYNRSGVPLVEIVSEPDLRSPEEAREFFSSLRQALVFLGVCDGKLQEGSMRADVNVSLRSPNGDFGTKVEIKNLNSFRAVQRALEYEIERQRAVIDAGDRVAQETRGWSEDLDVTVSQRSKEYAHDYRYFPEPDLPPIELSETLMEDVRKSMPEMPRRTIERLQQQYGLTFYDAAVLCETPFLARFFEDVVKAQPDLDPQDIAHWVAGEVLYHLNGPHPVESQYIRPEHVADIIAMVKSDQISRPVAKEVLELTLRSGEPPASIVDKRNLRRIGDVTELTHIVERVLTDKPALVQQYRAGKTQVLQAMVGQVMAATSGRADPGLARTLLLQALGGEDA